MDYAALDFWLKVLGGIWGIGMTVWAFWGGRTRSLKDKIDAVDTKVDGVDKARVANREEVLELLRENQRAIFVRLDSDRKDLSKAISDLGTDHGEKLTRIDERLKHVPDGEELEKVNGELKALVERTRAQGEKMDSISGVVSRIENFLLTNRS